MNGNVQFRNSNPLVPNEIFFMNENTRMHTTLSECMQFVKQIQRNTILEINLLI